MPPAIAPHRCALALLLVAGLASACARAEPAPGRLRVPPGFVVELVTDRLANARQLQLGAGGTLFAGTRSDGRVWALRDGEVHVIARGLDMPSGIALADGDLYVAAVDTVYRFDDIEAHLEDPPDPVVITDRLPGDGHHGWKHLEFAPDGMLWVPVGAPCNVCDPAAPYASLLRMDPRTGAFRVAARGIRNSVGFDFHPDSGALWFTDNGRDRLGDDVPPCELDRLDPAVVSGADPRVPHYGFPHLHGSDVRDPRFGAAGAFVLPVHEFAAHTAPLGAAFYTHDAFPEPWRGALFVAQHGSWNRSSKIGYRVMALFPEDGEVVRAEVFLTGFLEGEQVHGRPVDVLVDRDGSLLVSDDARGAVYRVRWVGDAVAGR